MSGKRTRGTGNDFQQAHKVNSKRIDISKLEAYLADGVLYIQAPSKESTKLTIPVTACRASEDAAKANIQSDDSTKSITGPNEHFDVSNKSADHMSGTRVNDIKSLDNLSTAHMDREDSKGKCTKTISPTSSRDEQNMHGQDDTKSDSTSQKNEAKKKSTRGRKSKLSFRRGFLL